MTHPSASGQRFIATAGASMWMVDIAKVLQRRLGNAAGQVSLRVLPNWLVRLASLKNPSLKGITPLLGVNLNATSDKARRLLGWTPRSREDAIVAAADSLIKLGLLNLSA
jgi:dihydroflavonol-4-reductase